jgi:uncharacterized protein (DUF2062 family)
MRGIHIFTPKRSPVIWGMQWTLGSLTLGHRVEAAARRGLVRMKVRVGGTQRQTSWPTVILPVCSAFEIRIARQQG